MPPKGNERRSLAITIAMIGAAAVFFPGPAQAQDAWEHRDPETVVADLNFPVDLAFGRDGYVYFPLLTQKEIRRADVDTGNVDEDFVVTFPDADWESGTETGLWSIALVEDFHARGVLYASYSSNEDDNWTNVLSRVTLHDETGAATEEVLLTRPGLEFHNGGRVMVADGHLWLTTGDAVHWSEADPQEARVAQEDGNLVGKVLRLTMDGDPAEGNPWGDHAYTKGHRNVFGIAWDPNKERAFITENADGGPDFIQILEPGSNYGWPDCEGFCEEPREEFTDPVWQAEHNIAPTGATWFRDAFWFGTFNQGELHRANDRDGEWEVEVVLDPAPNIPGVATGPDGTSIWFTTIDSIMRLQFPVHDDHPGHDPQESGPYWWELDEQNRAGDGAQPDDGPQDTPLPSRPFLLAVFALASFASILRRTQ